MSILDDPNRAAALAALLNLVATVLLVVVTGWYVWLTNQIMRTSRLPSLCLRVNRDDERIELVNVGQAAGRRVVGDLIFVSFSEEYKDLVLPFELTVIAPGESARFRGLPSPSHSGEQTLDELGGVFATIRIKGQMKDPYGRTVRFEDAAHLTGRSAAFWEPVHHYV